MRHLNDKSDEQLVALYVDGMNGAFDELIERHKDRVYTYIYHSIKDNDQANDIFQETFVKVIMTIKQGRYVENGHFLAWVLRIAHNLIIDFFRRTRNENLQSTDVPEVNVLNRKELSEDTVEDALVTSQIHKDVRRLIMALPEPQRQVLLMRYYRNMSFKEIADSTKVSINTALGRMRYALMNMRRMADEHHIALSV